MRKVTAKGGPLDGKSFLIHQNEHALTHHANTGGSYKVDGLTALWDAKTSDTDAQAQPTATDEVPAQPDRNEMPGCANHRLVQHRDNKPPWCDTCRQTANE